MRKLTSAVLAAAMTIVAMQTLASAPAQAAAAQEYVALGDSYASGVGAAPYDSASGACLRSPKSYPKVWASFHPAYSAKDVTCSGATIADVRSKQLSALSSRTTLVSITVGGNDAQFSPVATACLTESESYCEAATMYASYYARNQMVGELAGLYTDIKKRAPGAKVVVLGYPRLLAPTGSCGAISPSAAKRAYMNANADAVAEGTRAAASRAGVTFVDMRPVFAGHEACSAKPAINGVNLARLTETFHPNATGYEYYVYLLAANRT
ncbi:SGNH/GDSL hydrolase family protein [Micromonospora yangpuensis]|uniref:Lysophospholipase L1 n=1 Tax=Micromonospora yangpuensis TaxID=683228 RepID=A0A1C6TZT6_9ACTN|nr:SGNH/GDSL hydrolase family protein [Micromonospora yangpuensis]GGM21132.1 lipase 1 [Micromonospora yangpuensis]SCL47141.1 Lysophospholipase L1 [Micromonospora yangpuensis]